MSLKDKSVFDIAVRNAERGVQLMMGDLDRKSVV